MLKEIQILLADDDVFVRQELRTLLETEPNFKIVAEAGDGLAAINLTAKFKPDVVVLDVTMPHLNGLETAREMSKQFSDIKIIILSMYDDEDFVIDALGNGAMGYVLKDSHSSDLIVAVNEVTAGGCYLSPALSERENYSYRQFAKPQNINKLML